MRNYRGPTVRDSESQKINDAVTVRVNGKIFEGWKSVSITRALRALAGNFTLNVTNRWVNEGKRWELRPDDEVVIFIGGGKINQGRVITGYIDDLIPSIDKNQKELIVVGRDKTADFVECTATEAADKLEYENLTLERLANILAKPFGIKVFLRTPAGKPFTKWTIKQGETCFECLDRAARKRQIVLITSEVGNLLLVKRGQDRATSGLREGVNFKVGKSKYSNKGRYSKYICYGQQPGTDNFFGDVTVSSKGVAYDEGVRRFKPYAWTADTPVTQEEAQDMAEWEATVRAAKSSAVNGETPIWLQQDGRLWQVNELMPVHAPSLGALKKELLVSKTTFNKTKAGGSITNIELMRPDAFLPKKVIKEYGKWAK